MSVMIGIVPVVVFNIKLSQDSLKLLNQKPNSQRSITFCHTIQNENAQFKARSLSSEIDTFCKNPTENDFLHMYNFCI